VKKESTDLDAALLAYKHSLPPEAGEEMANLVRVAVAASRKGSWTRSLIVAVSALVGAGFSTGLFYSKLVFKTDLSPYAAKDEVTALAKSITDLVATQTTREETQNARITSTEGEASSAFKCCIKQQDRLDTILTPRPR
jgi:hypothetical protein